MAVLELLVLCVVCSGGSLAAAVGSDDLDWWKKAVIYQVYPRSFKDSDGDGIGDLKGIISESNYFTYLGIDCVWLGPVFPSAFRDFGYDLTDYQGIDPLFGTMDDFHNLVVKLHNQGLKLIIDFIPSYTSSDHDWFHRSANREGKYTDYYIWHDGILLANGTLAPPSNWISVFGGSAWEWHPTRQQYYYHSFLKEQPNLNHRTPNVEEEMKDILQYWLDKGVDGFRVDAVQALFVSSDVTLNEPRSGLNLTPFDYGYLENIHTSDQPEIVATVKSWYSTLEQYQKVDFKKRFMILETYANATTRNALYSTGGIPFNFDLAINNGQPTGFSIRDRVLNEYNNLPEGAWPNFVLGNHDQRRVSHKYGAQYMDLYNMLLLTLWGTATTYYGEELGMREGNISWAETLDPAGRNYGPGRYLQFSRDPERTPMQWTGGNQAGFTTGNKTWLPLAPYYQTINVQYEETSPSPTSIQLYSFLTRIRQFPAFQSNNFQVALVDNNIFSYIRWAGGMKYLVTLNVGQVTATSDYTSYVSEPLAVITAVTPSVQHMFEHQNISLASVTLHPGDGLLLFVLSESSIVGKRYH